MRLILLTQALLLLFTTGLFAQNCLVAAYDFNNSSMNDAVGVKNATASGTSFDIDRFGASNSSLAIAGSGSDQLAFVNHTIINAQNDFSISLWTNFSATPSPENVRYLITSRHNALGAERGGVDIQLTNGGEVICVLRTTSSIALANIKSDSMTANTWHHVVVVKEGTILKIYIDNVLNVSGNISTGTLPTPSFWTFGGMYNPGPVIIRELDGKLDDIQFYCKALSAAEINGIYLPVQQLYQETTSPITVYPNPVKNTLNIDLETTSAPYFIQIMNGTGQVLQSYERATNSTQIDVRELPAGVYFVRLREENKSFVTRKFVKK